MIHCNAERRPPAGSPDIPLVLATSRQVGQHHGAMVICAATIISNACIPSHPSFQSHRSGYCGNMKDDCMFAPSYIAADPSQSPQTNVCTIETITLFVYKRVTPNHQITADEDPQSLLLERFCLCMPYVPVITSHTACADSGLAAFELGLTVPFYC